MNVNRSEIAKKSRGEFVNDQLAKNAVVLACERHVYLSVLAKQYAYSRVEGKRAANLTERTYRQQIAFREYVIALTADLLIARARWGIAQDAFEGLPS